MSSLPLSLFIRYIPRIINVLLPLLGESGGCGITDDVMEWMDRVQNSAEPDVSRPVTANEKKLKPQMKPWNGDQESPGHKYSREANEPTHRRTRRATRPKEDNKNTCSLFIQTDPLIWRHISEQVSLEYVYMKVSSSFQRVNFETCLKFVLTLVLSSF